MTIQVWNVFWEIANAETPDLRMRKPGSKPSGAGFIEFSDAEGVSPVETMRRAKIIYKAPRLFPQGAWIPACAGMTKWGWWNCLISQMSTQPKS